MTPVAPESILLLIRSTRQSARDSCVAAHWWPGLCRELSSSTLVRCLQSTVAVDLSVSCSSLPAASSMIRAVLTKTPSPEYGSALHSCTWFRTLLALFNATFSDLPHIHLKTHSRFLALICMIPLFSLDCVPALRKYIFWRLLEALSSFPL